MLRVPLHRRVILEQIARIYIRAASILLLKEISYRGGRRLKVTHESDYL